MVSTAVLAQTADDRKWVAQCVRDNAGTASAAVIRAYCVCMNDKMDDNETRSISVWEKANPNAMRACERKVRLEVAGSSSRRANRRTEGATDHGCALCVQAPVNLPRSCGAEKSSSGPSGTIRSG